MRNKISTKKFKTIILHITKILIALAVVLGAYNFIFRDRVLPNTSVSGIDVSGLTLFEVRNMLPKKISQPDKITLVSADQKFDITLAEIGFGYNFERSSNKAFSLGKSGKLFPDLASSIESLWKKKDVKLELDYNDARLNETVSVIAGQVAIPEVQPSATFENKKVKIDPGKKGLDVDTQKLKNDIIESLTNYSSNQLKIASTITDPTLNETETENFKKRAEALVGKKMMLTFEFQTFFLTEKETFPLIGPKDGFNSQTLSELADAINTKIERKPQNPTFVFEEGRVKEFAPSKPGAILDKAKTTEVVVQKLKELSTTDSKEITANLVVSLTQPEVTTDKVNNLGIRELIGRGSSKFAHSIPSRVYNVNLAATRVNGTLVAPGETFSFNTALGDVSKLTGYKEAYVIKDGKTVLGDGGGVCQVSTTLFRAVMNAGLPIIERRAHAYRVGYYEQDSGPGLDATVYSPTTDFKFKNDTPGYVLIQTYPDTKNFSLVFELYGTNDGRFSTVTKPTVTDITPAPEDLYQDDPSLPTGTIKQIDFKASGAKTTFNYTVVRSGETIYQKTFVSNYRPWQAVYLRGTGVAL